jgi:hypothetical protein
MTGNKIFSSKIYLKENDAKKHLVALFKHYKVLYSSIAQNGFGNSKGYPDYLGYTSNGTHFVVEVKATNKKLRPEQARWRDDLVAYKQHWFLFDGSDATLKALLNFFETN